MNIFVGEGTTSTTIPLEKEKQDSPRKVQLRYELDERYVAVPT